MYALESIGGGSAGAGAGGGNSGNSAGGAKWIALIVILTLKYFNIKTLQRSNFSAAAAQRLQKREWSEGERAKGRKKREKRIADWEERANRWPSILYQLWITKKVKEENEE